MPKRSPSPSKAGFAVTLETDADQAEISKGDRRFLRDALKREEGVGLFYFAGQACR